MDHQYKSALTLGATGMLYGALQAVKEEAEHTVIVSRNAKERMQGQPLPRTTAINIDYADAANFMARLEQEIDLSAIDLALIWVHNPGLEVLWELLERFSSQPMRIVHVAGSAAGNPQLQAERIAQRINFGPQTEFTPVILGAMPASSGRRWLTHKEICAGTIRAIRSAEPQMIGYPLSHFE